MTAELPGKDTETIPAEAVPWSTILMWEQVRKESRVRMYTQSLTSIQTPGEQLAEIQRTQLKDEHDLDFKKTRDRTTAGLPGETVKIGKRRFLGLRRSCEPVTIVEHVEVTGEGKDETLSPITACVDGSTDDNEAGSANSGDVDNGRPEIETGFDDRDGDNCRPDVETGIDE